MTNTKPTILILDLEQPSVARYWGNPDVVARVQGILEEAGALPVYASAATRDDVIIALERVRPDLVLLNGYALDEEGHSLYVADLLESRGVPVVGSCASSYRYISKRATKLALTQHGIPTPRYFVVEDVPPRNAFATIDGPYVLKPDRCVQSLGIRVAHTADEAQAAIEALILEFEEPVVVEEYVRTREFVVGLIGNATKWSAYPIEVVLPHDEQILTTDRRMRGLTACVRPIEHAAIARDVSNLAIRTAQALCFRDWTHVDILMGEDTRLRVIDVSVLPGLDSSTEQPSMLPLCLSVCADLDISAVVLSVCNAALERYFTFTLPHLEERLFES